MSDWLMRMTKAELADMVRRWMKESDRLRMALEDLADKYPNDANEILRAAAFKC